MSKLNKIYLICLFAGIFLIGSAMLVQAVGFFSYEDNNKFILWANARITKFGLVLSENGAEEVGLADGGSLKIKNKAVYVRGFLAFNCFNYPNDINCSTTFGDIGGKTFIKVDELGSDDIVGDLEIVSSRKGFDLMGDSLILNGFVKLSTAAGGKNLILTDVEDKYLPTTTKSVFTNRLRVRTIADLGGANDTVTVADLEFLPGAFFNPRRVIQLPLQ